jgi:hypothetical protein
MRITTASYSIDMITEWIRAGDLKIDHPENWVSEDSAEWDDVQKSKLIDSIFAGVPISIFLMKDNNFCFKVIDGKKRLQAISEFHAGVFRLQGMTYNPRLEGHVFQGLEARELRRWHQAQIITHYTEGEQNPADIRELYRRLNGGRNEDTSLLDVNHPFPGHNQETEKHRQEVAQILDCIASELTRRGACHDQSKLEEPESWLFEEYGPRLKKIEYNGPEYKLYLKKFKTAVDHHYSQNRHHPEHFDNGIEGMTLQDLLEMLADWKAATMRNKNGNILKSLEVNAERFGISAQLLRILENTVKTLEKTVDKKKGIVYNEIKS